MKQNTKKIYGQKTNKETYQYSTQQKTNMTKAHT